mgnify:CR=1 FL=1
MLRRVVELFIHQCPMRNSYFLKIVGVSFIIFFTFIAEAIADVRCESSISYKWKKAQEEIELEVPFRSLESRGVDEPSARAKLKEDLEREQRKARESCGSEHENMTGCVASKYQSLGATLRQMNFSQRKSIEDAIAADCSAKQGRCGQVVSSEVKCEAIVTVAGTPATEEKGKEEKKGKKK